MIAPVDKGWNRKAPPLQGRGLGPGLSVEQIQRLQQRANEMRRNPTEPEKRLWRLIVEVDGDTHDAMKDRLRDDRLGFRIVRVTNDDVMSNMDGVQGIASALDNAPGRWDMPHPDPSPEGEGLLEGGVL